LGRRARVPWSDGDEPPGCGRLVVPAGDRLRVDPTIQISPLVEEPAADPNGRYIQHVPIETAPTDVTVGCGLFGREQRRVDSSSLVLLAPLSHRSRTSYLATRPPRPRASQRLSRTADKRGWGLCAAPSGRAHDPENG